MRVKTIIFTTLVCLFVVSINAQKTFSDSSIIGVWKGTSICQVKNSPCHDENVVYYISKIQDTDSFNISANKIVNGREEEMGVIGCRLDRKNSRLLATSNNTLWTFNFKDNDLDGTLLLRGDLYRIIKLKKQQ